MKKLKNIQAVIFDFDGVIIDSEPYWEKADVLFFSRRGKQFTQTIRRHIYGKGQHDNIKYFKKELGFLESVEELIDERLSLLYEVLLPNMTLMEGAENLITDLHKKGFPLAIATGGHNQKKMKEILQHFGFLSYFSVIITSFDVVNGKPSPEPYVKTAELLKVDPASCLVFEDSVPGVVAGKAAGMTVYGVNKDEEMSQKLKDAGADKVFHSLAEIIV
jgi:HAD superfamily hydrolase (TIGR01509 family)